MYKNMIKYFCYGMWLSLVERCVRDAKAAGSNPVIPTKKEKTSSEVFSFFIKMVRKSTVLHTKYFLFPFNAADLIHTAIS